MGSKKIVPKPHHIADLESRQKALEGEVAKAILHCSADDPMILDLKRRMLHLRRVLSSSGCEQKPPLKLISEASRTFQDIPLERLNRLAQFGTALP